MEAEENSEEGIALRAAKEIDRKHREDMEALRQKLAEEEEAERRRLAKEKADAEARLRKQLLDQDEIERSAVAVRGKNKEKETGHDREL